MHLHACLSSYVTASSSLPRVHVPAGPAMAAVLDQVVEFANTFVWKSGETFLSDIRIVAVLLVGYLATSFGIQALMKNRPAFNPTALIVLHNAGLCILSFAMLLGTLYEVITLATTLYKDQPFYGIYCDPDKLVMTGSTRFPFWSYIFYLSKYWEVWNISRFVGISELTCWHSCVCSLLTRTFLR
jgi:hypothetical protein